MTYCRNTLTILAGFMLAVTATFTAGAAPLHRGVSSVTASQQRVQPRSFACAPCHNAEFALWVAHPHSHSLIDVAATPERLLPPWREDTPGWNQVGAGRFHRGDVALAIGQNQVQVFFRADRDGHRLLPGQWNVARKQWEPLAEPFEDLRKNYRTWEQECLGCHSTWIGETTLPVNAEATEPGVGCPACHGAGTEHMARGGLGPIVNPAKLDPGLRSQICAACHARGTSTQGSHPYPVGFQPGQPLAEAYTVAQPGPDQGALFWPDNSERRPWMEYQGFVQSGHHQVGIACTTCHATHGSDQASSLRRDASELCRGCHPNPPVAVRAHGLHPAEKAGCVDCHMPTFKLNAFGPRVPPHTFRFLYPLADGDQRRPSSCTASCHPGRGAEWTRQTLADWATAGAKN